MAESPTPTPTATLDAAAVQKMIADALKPVTEALKPIADNQKILADTMAADATARANAAKAEADKATAAGGKAPPAAGEAPKPLTAEDIAKLVNDGISGALKTRDDQAKSSAARDAFIGEKLKGVPAAYQQQLGTDPAKWGEQEQAIRAQLKSDLAAIGATVKDVGGNPGGTTASSAAAAAAPNLTAANSGLTEGQAAYARALQLPSLGGAPPASPPPA